ncbi:hypothetical protein [Acinetobacter junii]|uniref:hypothetical protein n=1 Tax=Acinetobacter junii TaxID=40215 RepID=UPI00100F0D26|nr:hypothetical protein [Acinetobacter junii]RXS99036.1 hypothetical protein ETZ13_04460 [Acinetobacter junii]
MANINAWITAAYLNHEQSNYVSKDLDDFKDEAWFPVHHSVVKNLNLFQLGNHFPIKANSKPLQFFKTKSFFDDFYNRIHISPSLLELGNIASEQSQTVSLWNSYLESKVLLDIENIPDGIHVSGQPNPPLSFTALQELSWDLSILSDGPSSIDSLITWQFGSDVAKLHITGTRIIAFGWLVDWSNNVKETLQWRTDILQSSSGYEQRRALRLAPKISLEADFLLVDKERQFFDLVMVGWGARTFVLPIWNQQQWLQTTHNSGSFVVYCDTTYRNFRSNRLALLRGQDAFDNETIEIESVLSDRLILKRPLIKTWSKGTCLSPAATTQLESPPQLIKRTDRMMRCHLIFNLSESIDHAASLPTTTYRNYPVFAEAPNEHEDLTHSHERLLHVIENATGVSLKTDTAKAAFQLYRYQWLTHGRLSQANLRSFLYGLRGSQKAVWLPTFSDDLTLKATITSTSQSMDVEWCGYTRFAVNQLGRQDIQITLKSGVVLFRRIISSTEINNQTERLLVDSIFPNQILTTDIIRISFISLCRLSNDTVSIEHINDSDGVAKCSVVWRGVRES